MPTETTSLHEMFEMLEIPSSTLLPEEAYENEAKQILAATMQAMKLSIKDETTWHVFIQDFAASLNRKGFLSNTNEQLFREWAYSYRHATK